MDFSKRNTKYFFLIVEDFVFSNYITHVNDIFYTEFLHVTCGMD